MRPIPMLDTRRTLALFLVAALAVVLAIGCPLRLSSQSRRGGPDVNPAPVQCVQPAIENENFSAGDVCR